MNTSGMKTKWYDNDEEKCVNYVSDGPVLHYAQKAQAVFDEYYRK